MTNATITIDSSALAELLDMEDSLEEMADLGGGPLPPVAAHAMAGERAQAAVADLGAIDGGAVLIALVFDGAAPIIDGFINVDGAESVHVELSKEANGWFVDAMTPDNIPPRREWTEHIDGPF